ncbi:hypothetical protein K0M31_008788, partial [Melipona bicolor]
MAITIVARKDSYRVALGGQGTFNQLPTIIQVNYPRWPALCVSFEVLASGQKVYFSGLDVSQTGRNLSAPRYRPILQGN